MELRRPVIQLAIDREGGRQLALAGVQLGHAAASCPRTWRCSRSRSSTAWSAVSAPARGELAQFEAINGEFIAEALEGPFKFRGTLKWAGAERGVRARHGTPRCQRRHPVQGFGRRPRDRATPICSTDASATSADGRGSTASSRRRSRSRRNRRAAMAAIEKAAAPVKAPEPPPVVTAPPVNRAQDARRRRRRSAVRSTSPELQLTAPAVDAHGRPKFDLRAKLEGDGAGFRLDDVTVTLEQGGPPQLITGSANLAWAEKMRLDVEPRVALARSRRAHGDKQRNRAARGGARVL